MSALDCPNPFNFDNHDENNQSPLKRVSLLIQSHALTFGFALVVGDRICDKCRLFARNKHEKVLNSRKRNPIEKNDDNPAPTKMAVQSNASFLRPMSDSSEHDDSSNEPYSDKFHKQRALNENTTALVHQLPQYDDDSLNSTPKDNTSTSNTTNENSNSLHSMATANPVSELKIVAVTSLPAEKHNEIMNNDDNAMNATDSIYNHQLQISEIISSASNSNVFGIAKKPIHNSDDANHLLTSTSINQHRQISNQLLKKKNMKAKNLKQRIQNSFRFPNAHGLRTDILSIGTNKESTDSDEHSNSKLNRRKDTLQPLDCEMEFVELSPPKYRHRQAHMTNEQKVLSAQLETVKKKLKIQIPTCYGK